MGIFYFGNEKRLCFRKGFIQAVPDTSLIRQDTKQAALPLENPKFHAIMKAWSGIIT
jgi:hypothetical protein